MNASYGALVRSAYLLCGNGHRAEDLVQTVLAKVYPRWGRVRQHENVRAYVHSALTRTYISDRRRRWNGESPSPDLPQTTAGTDRLGVIDDRDALRVTLQSLPTRQRAALVLRFYHQYSEAETAASMGCSVASVKALTRRGLQAVRARPSLINDLSQ